MGIAQLAGKVLRVELGMRLVLPCGATFRNLLDREQGLLPPTALTLLFYVKGRVLGGTFVFLWVRTVRKVLVLLCLLQGPTVRSSACGPLQCHC